MEMYPRPQKIIYTDVFAGLDCDKYRKQILMVELGLPEPTDENDGPLESEPLEELDKDLGYGDEEESAIYTGLAYKLDKHGLPILTTPHMFVDQELMFCGTGYHDIEEKWRVLFEFRDTSSKKMPTYVALFDAMTRLAIVENPSEKYDVSRTLHQHTELSKIITCDPGFYTEPESYQMERLESLAKSCHNVLLETVDPKDISVEAPLFYVHADNTDEEKSAITCVDQTLDRFEERTAITGDMMSVSYLEICLNPGRSFADASELFVGGVPCVVVRNDVEGTTNYIPIDKIESIEKNS